MQCQLKNLIISSIKRDPRNNLAIAETKEETDINTVSEVVSNKLTTLFKGTGIRVGDFINSTQSVFETRLTDFYSTSNVHSNDFKRFGTDIAVSLARKLNTGQAQSAKDGFLVTYLYSSQLDEEDPVDYMCVIFLHRIIGADINEQDLILEEIERVNLESLNLGAKISIADWNDEDERAISFKLGKDTGDIRRYFIDFLGCEETSEHVEDTANLLNVIDDVCEFYNIDDNVKNDLLDSAKSYCQERMRTFGDNKISLEVLSRQLFPEQDCEKSDKFMEIALDDYRLSEQIVLDNKTLQSFSRLQGRTNLYTVNFKRSAITSDVVNWDPDEGTLTFTELPEELVEQLNSL